ncbi:MAG: prolyl oligopeptidase family serine peptidase [Terriglobales bacterium]
MLTVVTSDKSAVHQLTRHRESPNTGWRGGTEYKGRGGGRQVFAVASLSGQIGWWGGSYGGYLTAMGLARNSDLFAAGVDMHGVHEWWAEARSLAADAGRRCA